MAMLSWEDSRLVVEANWSVSSVAPDAFVPKAVSTLISSGCRLSMMEEMSTQGLSMRGSRLPCRAKRGNGGGIVWAGENGGPGHEHVSSSGQDLSRIVDFDPSVN